MQQRVPFFTIFLVLCLSLQSARGAYNANSKNSFANLQALVKPTTPKAATPAKSSTPVKPIPIKAKPGVHTPLASVQHAEESKHAQKGKHSPKVAAAAKKDENVDPYLVSFFDHLFAQNSAFDTALLKALNAIDDANPLAADAKILRTELLKRKMVPVHGEKFIEQRQDPRANTILHWVAAISDETVLHALFNIIKHYFSKTVFIDDFEFYSGGKGYYIGSVESDPIYDMVGLFQALSRCFSAPLQEKDMNLVKQIMQRGFYPCGLLANADGKTPFACAHSKRTFLSRDQFAPVEMSYTICSIAPFTIWVNPRDAAIKPMPAAAAYNQLNSLTQMPVDDQHLQTKFTIKHTTKEDAYELNELKTGIKEKFKLIMLLLRYGARIAVTTVA